MKKLFLLLMLGIGLLSTSCEKEPFLEYELPNLGNVLEFTADGGSIDVDITAECSYEILCKDNWISYTETNFGIAVTAQANLDTNIRESEIRILYYHRKDQIYKSIKVMQSAFEPKLQVDKTKLNYDVNGGSKTIYITTNAEFNFSESSSWISCSKSSNKVTIKVSASDVTEGRSADVKIYLTKYDLSKTVKITQKQFEPEFEVQITELDFEAEGGTKTISVSANFDYSVSERVDWLSYQVTSSGVKLTATANVDEKERTAEITISSEKYGLSKKISVSQAGLPKDSTNAIFYTSYNDTVVTPHATSVFGANIVSNTYNNGQGIIIFDAPITTIGESAFYYCRSLISVTIPKSVTKIGVDAFWDCDKLGHVEISDLSAWCKIDFENPSANPLSNGADLYLNNTKITELVIPSDIAEIKKYAFSGCESLTSVIIPDNITKIGYSAFNGCRFTWITIPKSVIEFGDNAFSNCDKLGHVEISDLSAWCKIDFDYSAANPLSNGADLYLNNTKITELVIPSDITELKFATFYNCSSIEQATIPDSVTKIGKSTFAYCSNLTSVTIPDSITSIGDYAFAYCRNLTITIPNSVTKIGWQAFCDCAGELIINNKNLVETDYVSNNYPADSYDGWLYNSKFTKLTIGNNITKIGNYAFSDCDYLKTITISDSVTSIGNYAFSDCDYLKTITIPDSVTSIGNYAFSGCKDSITTNVYISDLANYCNGNMMYRIPGSKNLKFDGSYIQHLKVPDSVTNIGKFAFMGCTDIYNVTIHNNVTSIGNSAFKDCFSYGLIVYISDLSAWCKIDFGDKYANPIVHNGGRLYLNNIEIQGELTIPSDITEIKAYTFMNCDSIKEVTIPDSVTKIGAYAFSDCDHSYFSQINIPDSVTEIGRSAFEGCGYLDYITIGNGITKIGEHAFSDCKSRLSVKSYPTTPPTGNYQMFGEYATIYVRNYKAESAYKEAKYWNNYDIITRNF